MVMCPRMCPRPMLSPTRKRQRSVSAGPLQACRMSERGVMLSSCI
jgi:hypothetical protein